MKQSTFKNGARIDRNIIIKITDDYIYFYFEKEYFDHIEWVNSSKLCDSQELDEEEINPCEFYGFEKERWSNKQFDFPAHMNRKNWFTSEMLNFINENTANPHNCFD